MTAARGPTRFARFAYPPNALGLCGPDDHLALAGYAASGEVDGGLRRLAEGFEGAWPYLRLLAGSAGTDDPLDGRVVEAYWLGNDLSEQVPRRLLAGEVDARFGRRAGSSRDRLRAAVVAGLPLTHGFHVFAVYPWVGLLRSGAAAQACRVLDRCRIRWGTVEVVLGDRALVRSRPLQIAEQPSGPHLVLGEPVVEEVTVGIGGDGFVSELRPGDAVALHWDWVCERLDAAALGRLRRHTAADLAFVRSLGPAVADALTG